MKDINLSTLITWLSALIPSDTDIIIYVGENNFCFYSKADRILRNCAYLRHEVNSFSYFDNYGTMVLRVRLKGNLI